MTDISPAQPPAAPVASRAPWWWPSNQTFVAFGMFALTIIVLVMFDINPDLDKHVLFVSMATAIVMTGWGGIAGFYFGSSVGSAKKDATILSQAQGSGQ
jgi:hypothetical protein